MKILHTSDWHIGRTFHSHPTLDHLQTVLDALADAVARQSVDVVVVAGDVFDTVAPSTAAIEVFERALRRIRGSGAQIVLTSGNHDSITRLGMHAEWLATEGVHLLTRSTRLAAPVTIDDAHGPVHFYGIPYLEPALLHRDHPDAVPKTHEQALAYAMTLIRCDLERRGGRSVVLAHCFAAGVAQSDEARDVERDIRAGGLGVVPLSVFDGPDYVALGHIHRAADLGHRVRYSGAPLHYSFGEADRPRGGWLVDLGPDGLGHVDWQPLPVPRTLVELHGQLEQLLADPALAQHEPCWVKAVVTDQVRPMDGIRQLQARFPNCVAFEWRPSELASAPTTSYSQRMHGRSDFEIIADFLELTRNGAGPTAPEAALVAELLGTRARRQDVA